MRHESVWGLVKANPDLFWKKLSRLRSPCLPPEITQGGARVFLLFPSLQGVLTQKKIKLNSTPYHSDVAGSESVARGTENPFRISN